MKANVLFLAVLIGIFFFPSCSEVLLNDDSSQIINDNAVISRSVENDSIILPFNEEDFPLITRKSRSIDFELSEELEELVGIPFRIRAVNVGNLNTFQTNGKGKELLLRAYDEGNTNQLFRLLSLPIESGVPYMIYSNKENVPIGIGSYSSDPQTPVLYAKANDSGSTWGFGWSIYSSSNDNAFVMENVNYYTTNTNLSDPVVYYSITASTGGELSIEPTTKGLNQQFVYVPEGVWNIVSLETHTEDASIVSTTDVDVMSRQYINRSEEPLNAFFSVHNEFSDSVYFRETKRITTTKNVSPKLSIKLLKILTKSIGFEFGEEEIMEIEYVNSINKKTTITDSLSFVVPAYTKKVVNYKSYRHKVRIPYTLSLMNADGVTLKIRGVYDDTSYSEMEMEVSSFPLNVPSNRMFCNEVEPIHKETIISGNFSVTSVFEP